MQKINFHLARADFVNQRIDIQPLRLAIIVHIFKQRIELVHRIDAIRLATRLRAAAATDRRLQRNIRIDVTRGQIKLQFRRDDRRPAFFMVHAEHTAQHRARREIHDLAIEKETIVNHLRGRIDGPRDDANGFRIGFQNHVWIVVGHDRIDFLRLGIIPRHGLHHHRLRQPQTLVLTKFRARQNFAARHPG